MASNVELLTQSHKAVKAKKRQKVNAVVFDEDARREFLTGFHKRKLAKKEESKKRAQAREKEEHLEARREQRRVLAEQAAQNAAEVEKAYGGSFSQNVESDQESWTGITSRLDLEREREHEYSDEEQLATVTVVEDFDPSALLHRAATSDDGDDTELPAAERRPLLSKPPPPPSGMASRSRKDHDGLAKKKVVRYETKAARRATRATQRTRRTEKAERAGGKAARKNAGGKKPRARK